MWITSLTLGSWHCDVVGHVTIWYPTFLLMEIKFWTCSKFRHGKNDTTEPLRFIPEHHGHIYGYTRIYHGHTRFITVGLPANRTIRTFISNGFREIWPPKLLNICFQIYMGMILNSWLFRVKWRHRPRDRLIPQVPISYRCATVTSLYVQPFSKYWAPNISGSRPWPFKVTWRHQSCDHLIRHMPFCIDDP